MPLSPFLEVDQSFPIQLYAPDWRGEGTGVFWARSTKAALAAKLMCIDGDDCRLRDGSPLTAAIRKMPFLRKQTTASGGCLGDAGARVQVPARLLPVMTIFLAEAGWASATKFTAIVGSLRIEAALTCAAAPAVPARRFGSVVDASSGVTLDLAIMGLRRRAGRSRCDSAFDSQDGPFLTATCQLPFEHPGSCEAHIKTASVQDFRHHRRRLWTAAVIGSDASCLLGLPAARSAKGCCLSTVSHDHIVGPLVSSVSAAALTAGMNEKGKQDGTCKHVRRCSAGNLLALKGSK